MGSDTANMRETTVATYNREGTDKTTHAVPVLRKFQLHGAELTDTFQLRLYSSLTHRPCSAFWSKRTISPLNSNKLNRLPVTHEHFRLNQIQ